MHRSAPATTCSTLTRPAGGRAFTLLELLVVIGILVVLVGLLFPVLSSIAGDSRRAAAEQVLGSITTAIDAYRLDFDDIPRTPNARRDDGLGFAVLTYALLGPGPAAATAPVDDADTPDVMGAYANASAGSQVDAQDVEIFTAETVLGDQRSAVAGSEQVFDIHDGADGPGVRAGGGTTGRVYGPYYPEASRTGMAIRTPDGAPVIYIPARRQVPDLSQGTNYVAASGNAALYNFGEVNHRNFDPDATAALREFRLMLGDADNNGRIDAGENAVKQDYLLISAGVDGEFGYLQGESDDATNFDFVRNRN